MENLKFIFADLVEFFKSIDLEQWLLYFSLFGNFIFAVFKLKGSKFEKDYKKALKNIAKHRYYVYVAGKYYSLDDVKYVPIDSISKEEYQLKKGV